MTAQAEPPKSFSQRVGKDLGPRLIAALIMAAASLFALWMGGYLFAALVLAACVAIAWEWGRIVRSADRDVVMAAHVGTVVGAVGASAVG